MTMTMTTTLPITPRIRRGLAQALRALLAVLLLAGTGAATAQAERRGEPNAETSPVWLKVRASLFGTRPIASPGADVIELQAPDRAEDAAVVPLAVTVGFPQTAARRVERLWLVIDENPSPISAVFTFGPRSGRADIETRVRINDYTFVRAIAELADGSLHMSTRYVKAAGGCSAPPGKDREAALAGLGRMRLRMDPPAEAQRPTLAQLMISHPNDSGMVMDQVSRLFTPARFVRTVEIADGRGVVLSADLDFSIS